MGATCQLDWQLGLTRINFNGSCQGTPGAPTWQIWQTHICSHGETDVQHIRTHICSYIVNRDVSVCLSLWSGWCLDFCSFVPSHVHRLLKKRPKEMPVMEGLLCPCELMRSFSFCVTQPFNTLGLGQQNWNAMKSCEPSVRNVPGKTIPGGGWNQNSGKKRKFTCSAKEKCIRPPLFTAVSVCICWHLLKPVDYVMLTEQGNDVFCAWQVTISEKGCRFAFWLKAGGKQSEPGVDRWCRGSYCNWSANTE